MFLVDTNVIVYAATAGPLAPGCQRIVEAVAAGRADGNVSAAIVEELWRLELRGRPRGIDGLTRAAYEVFRPVLAVSDEIVARALDLRAPGLGANDRIHVATCLASGIPIIVSADAAFDGVSGLRRVDPGNERAVGRLLNR